MAPDRGRLQLSRRDVLHALGLEGNQPTHALQPLCNRAVLISEGGCRMSTYKHARLNTSTRVICAYRVRRHPCQQLALASYG